MSYPNFLSPGVTSELTKSKELPLSRDKISWISMQHDWLVDSTRVVLPVPVIFLNLGPGDPFFKKHPGCCNSYLPR